MSKLNQVLEYRAEEKQELLAHPFAEGTFGDDYVLTPDDVKLLEAMQQRSK